MKFFKFEIIIEKEKDDEGCCSDGKMIKEAKRSES
jgi:hypothetical protein